MSVNRGVHLIPVRFTENTCKVEKIGLDKTGACLISGPFILFYRFHCISEAYL